jgi:chromosome segregation protein
VLKGFKSFADRSVLSFEPGLTAVVGPNGSGKSNISDAVLWVLGERNAKHLRGQAMEDVIFAGSSARKPAGLAEVDLILDNSDGTIPIDYTEIALTRRMYRNGESEYLINGASARRMDVMDILHDSGIGTGTHSIISQGHLSSILQSKPEDRRALIEEAAGVLKHRQRKEKSERKLAQMDVHLTRVKDIVGEVERQIRPLERKAKRAMKYRELSGELAELNLDLAVDDLRVLQQSWDEIGTREKDFQSQITDRHAAIEQADAEVERLQGQLRDAANDAGTIAQRYRRAQTSLDRLDANVLLLHEKKRSSQTYLSELRISLDGDDQAIRDLDQQCDEANQAYDQAQAERVTAQHTLEQASAHDKELTDQRRALQDKIDAAYADRRRTQREMDEARKRQAHTKEVISQNRAHAKLIEAHESELSQQLADAQHANDEAVESKDRTNQEFAEVSEREDQARQTVGEALVARDASRTANDETHDTCMRLSAEVQSREDMERAHQEENPLLAWALDHAQDIEHEVRPLVSVLHVPQEYDALVERLLGTHLSGLLVDDTDAALSIVSRLTTTDETGAISLLPISNMHHCHVDTSAGKRLIDVIDYPSSDASVIEALLGDVVLYDDASDALSAAHDTPGLCAATQDGCIVWPNGMCSFSRKGEGDDNALTRQRLLDTARAHLVDARAAFDKASHAYKVADQALRDAQSAQLALSQKRAQLQGSLNAAAGEAERAAHKLGSIRHEMESLESQRDQAQDALAKAEPDADALQNTIDELEQHLREVQKSIASMQSDLNPLRDEVDRSQAALASAKVASATCTERVTYAERVRQARDHDREQAKEKHRIACKTISRKSAVLERIDPLLTLCQSLCDVAKSRTARLEEDTLATENSSNGLHAQIDTARAHTRELHDSFDAINQQLADVRVEKGRMEVQVEAAIKTITDDCSTPIEQAMEMPQLEERTKIEEHAFKLRRRITNMGTINPDAATEYEELKRRYDYLSEQLGDMVSARQALVRIVHIIDQRMKDDFVSTFHEVDNNFREIFALLFPGGSGSLELVDADDPEHTGVEINAQPRGKRIVKMSLMSGGEKSLTAMALLFAVYKARSTPFYILDEVEAALDDTNLRRLCAYLNAMRDQTQFIMITHQRRTMEMSDVLYGVSMHADGVTKVISQRLDKALRYADDQ